MCLTCFFLSNNVSSSYGAIYIFWSNVLVKIIMRLVVPFTVAGFLYFLCYFSVKWLPSHLWIFFRCINNLYAVTFLLVFLMCFTCILLQQERINIGGAQENTKEMSLMKIRIKVTQYRKWVTELLPPHA